MYTKNRTVLQTFGFLNFCKNDTFLNLATVRDSLENPQAATIGYNKLDGMTSMSFGRLLRGLAWKK